VLFFAVVKMGIPIEVAFLWRYALIKFGGL
jgi:hypothetical protein